MLTPQLDRVASYVPIAEALAVAFQAADIPETTLPVKNTFINFDASEESPRSSDTDLRRSLSCPPFFPAAYSLADSACWEGATQVLCHGMSLPRREYGGEAAEMSSARASDFATPVSSPRCFCSSISDDGSCSSWMSVESAGWTQVARKRRKAPEASICQSPVATLSRGCRSKTQYFHKCEVGIQDDSAFRVVRRLLGPGGENLKHIMEESQGAKVWICGQGSRRSESARDRDVGPLTICVSAGSQASLDQASSLVQDLLLATHEDYTSFWSQDAAVATSAASHPSVFSDNFEVGIDEDSSFKVVKRLLGKGGKNLKRIEADSGASVQLRGRRSSKGVEELDTLEVHVSAPSQRSFDSAAASMMSLLTRVHADYSEFCSAHGQAFPPLSAQR